MEQEPGRRRAYSRMSMPSVVQTPTPMHKTDNMEHLNRPHVRLFWRQHALRGADPHAHA